MEGSPAQQAELGGRGHADFVVDQTTEPTASQRVETKKSRCRVRSEGGPRNEAAEGAPHSGVTRSVMFYSSSWAVLDLLCFNLIC